MTPHPLLTMPACATFVLACAASPSPEPTVAYNEPARVAEPVPASAVDDDIDDDIDDDDVDDDDKDDKDFDDDDADEGGDDDDDDDDADENVARTVGVLAVLRDSSEYGMIGLLNGGEVTAVSNDPSQTGVGRGPTPPPTPGVALLPPQVSDAGFQPVVVRVVRAHLPLLRACYAQATSAPPMQGIVTVTFTVDERGTVQNPSASSAALSAVHRCFEGVIGGLSLPSPGKQSVRVSYPMRLSPSKP